MSMASAAALSFDVRAKKVARIRRKARLGFFATALFVAVLLAFSLYSILIVDTDWTRITMSGLLKSVQRFALVDIGLLPSLFEPALETLLMALLGTLVGAAMALPIAWLGAMNVTPLGRVSYVVARALMTISRSVHEIVWGLIFIAAAGLGTLAGILAMAVRSIGFISKTVAEAIEDVDQGPIEAMRAVGASRLQILFYSILPQVVPVLLGNIVFEWDVNIRRSTVMGLVGAGGLGLAMQRQLAAYNYGGLSAVILAILFLILLGEVGSYYARKAIL